MLHPAPPPTGAPPKLDRSVLARKIAWMRRLIATQLAHLAGHNGVQTVSLLIPLSTTDRQTMEMLDAALCSLEEALPSGSITELRAQYVRALTKSRSESEDPRKFYEHLLEGARVFEPLQMNGKEESC